MLIPGYKEVEKGSDSEISIRGLLMFVNGFGMRSRSVKRELKPRENTRSGLKDAFGGRS